MCKDSGTGKISSGTGRNRGEPAEKRAEPLAGPAEPGAGRKRQVVWPNDGSFCENGSRFAERRVVDFVFFAGARVEARGMILEAREWFSGVGKNSRLLGIS